MPGTHQLSRDWALGKGEREAIILAEEIQGVLLVDEPSARQEAASRNLMFLGSLGILREAKQQGIIHEVASHPPGSFLLALALVATLGSTLQTVIMAISIAYAPRNALVMRSVILTGRENAYVEAARAAGASGWRTVTRHVLPNAVPPLIVMASINAAIAITAEAGLSFLGLGVQPPTPTWGAIISDGRDFVRTNPWICISAGAAIMVTVMALNLLGDALRDLLDPRLRGALGNV